MDIKYFNERVYFYSGSSRLEIQLNSMLECNIGILKKIANNVDDEDITKEVSSFRDLRLNHWRRKDLLKAIKVAELFLPNSYKDKDVLELLSYDILKELLDRLKGG